MKIKVMADQILVAAGYTSTLTGETAALNEALAGTNKVVPLVVEDLSQYVGMLEAGRKETFDLTQLWKDQVTAATKEAGDAAEAAYKKSHAGHKNLASAAAAAGRAAEEAYDAATTSMGEWIKAGEEQYAAWLKMKDNLMTLVDMGLDPKLAAVAAQKGAPFVQALIDDIKKNPEHLKSAFALLGYELETGEDKLMTDMEARQEANAQKYLDKHAEQQARFQEIYLQSIIAAVTDTPTEEFWTNWRIKSEEAWGYTPPGGSTKDKVLKDYGALEAAFYQKLYGAGTAGAKGVNDGLWGGIQSLWGGKSSGGLWDSVLGDSSKDAWFRIGELLGSNTGEGTKQGYAGVDPAQDALQKWLGINWPAAGAKTGGWIGTSMVTNIMNQLKTAKFQASVDIVFNWQSPMGDYDPNAFMGGKKFDGLASSASNVWYALKGHDPGAVWAGGLAKRPYTSDHTTGHAFDFGGSAAQMNRDALWLSMIGGSLGVKQIIHNPLGVWRAGSGWSPYIPSANVQAFAGASAWHYDHVHVGTFDKGGILPPGVTLAANWTGKPERILTNREGDTYDAMGNRLGSLERHLDGLAKAVSALSQSGGHGGTNIYVTDSSYIEAAAEHGRRFAKL